MRKNPINHIYLLFLFLAFSSIYAQEKKPSTEEIYKQYQQAETVQDRYFFIESFNYTDYNTDSLLAKMFYQTINEKLEIGDTADVLCMSNSLMNYYYYPLSEPDSSIHLYNRLKNFIENYDIRQGGNILLGLGDAYFAQNKLKKSYDAYKKALKEYEQVGDSTLPSYPRAYIYAAEVAATMGNYAQSSFYYENAQSLSKYQKDTTLLIYSMYGMSEIYSKLGLLDKVDTILTEIQSIGDLSSFKKPLTSVYAATSSNALKRNNYDKAIKYAHKTLSVSKQLEDKDYFLLNSYLLLSRCFQKSNQIDSLRQYFQFTEKYAEKFSGNKFYTTQYLLLKAFLAYANGNLSEAQSILDENFNEIDKIESYEDKLDLLNLRFRIDTTRGNYNSAISHLSKFKSLQDTNYQTTLDNQFTYYQTKFENASKQRRIAEQKAEIVKLDLENRRQRNLWIAIIGGIIFLSALFYFIRSKKFSDKKKKIQEEYSQLLLSAQEEERRRISRELHDSVGQSLILIKNKAKLENSHETQELAEKTLSEVRQVSQGLHPFVLENLGLTSSIRKLVQNADESHDIFFDLKVENVDNLLPKKGELNLYRILQEAITNLLKHSEANAAKVLVKKLNNFIFIKIQDFGKGFDKNESDEILYSMGMRTMKERTKISNGHITITSEKNVGTTVELMIPY